MVFAICAILAVALGGHLLGTGSDRQQGPTTAAKSSATRFTNLPANRPTSIAIATRHVSAPIEPMGRRRDGTVEVPNLDVANLVGWYAYGPVPGDPGPAVLLGHRDANGAMGALYYIYEMKPGEVIEIGRADGSVAKFAVTSVERFPKRTFPTQRVYVDSAGAELRLVTCGGAFDPKTEDYADNIIVFARSSSD